MNLFDILDTNSINYQMVGSKAIDPAGQNNDIDYLVLVENLNEFDKTIQDNNYKRSSDYFGSDFTAYRKGEYNLIVTEQSKFYDCFVIATRLSILLECKSKQERIIVHDMVMKPHRFNLKNNITRK